MSDDSPAQIGEILVVDDDAGLRETLCDFFELEGYGVRQAGNVAEARSQLAAGAPDLMLLDVNMPGGDGISFAAELRARTAMPIIIVSGKGAMVDRVVGLEIGADDYVAKPFELRELLARVRAVLRRTRIMPPAGGDATAGDAGAGGNVARFGGLTLDPARRSVTTTRGGAIDLTGAEFNLLAALAERSGRVMSRDAIAELLHGGDWQSFDRSIDTLVSRLRRKLEPHVDAANLIQTIRGEGYVLATRVEWSGGKS